MEKQLWLTLAYYHFCLPHESLREKLPQPQGTRGSGSLRKRRLVTPAMAAGMTDHIWSTSELLGYRVPAPFLDTRMQSNMCSRHLTKLITSVEGHHLIFRAV
jgi:hypothetical protein